jgi:hypothetical protein
MARQPRILMTLAFTLANLSLLGGCHTTRAVDDTLSRLATSSEKGRPITLSAEETRLIYEQITRVETEHRIVVNERTLHTAKARLDCQTREGTGTCDARVRLGDKLSDRLPLDKSLHARVHAALHDARADIGGDAPVSADLICDHVGPDAPPGGKNETSCEIINPRMPDEVVLEGREAEEIAGLLILNTSPAASNTSPPLQGKLNCFTPDIGQRARCHVSVMARGETRITELEARFATPIDKALRRGIMDALPAGPLPSKAVLPAKATLTGSLNCVVDEGILSRFGRREYLCRVIPRVL